MTLLSLDSAEICTIFHDRHASRSPVAVLPSDRRQAARSEKRAVWGLGLCENGCRPGHENAV